MPDEITINGERMTHFTEGDLRQKLDGLTGGFTVYHYPVSIEGAYQEILEITAGDKRTNTILLPSPPPLEGPDNAYRIEQVPSGQKGVDVVVTMATWKGNDA